MSAASSGDVQVITLAVGPMQNLSYLLISISSGQALAIDPGFQPEAFTEAAHAAGATLAAIALTHVHYDHSAAADQLAAAHGNPPIFSPAGVEELRNRRGNWVVPRQCLPLSEGDHLRIPGIDLRVLETPGHQKRHLSFVDHANLFSGDALFIGRLGRVDLPESCPQAVPATLDKFRQLPPHLLVRPGHDYGSVPTRTLAEEIANNSAFL